MSTNRPRRSRRSSERGASLVEYALLLALIAVVCIAAVSFLGKSGSTKLRGAGDGIAGSTCYESAEVHWFIDSNGQSSGYLSGPCP